MQVVCVFGINTDGKEAAWGQWQRENDLSESFRVGVKRSDICPIMLVIRRGLPWEGCDLG